MRSALTQTFKDLSRSLQNLNAHPGFSSIVNDHQENMLMQAEAQGLSVRADEGTTNSEPEISLKVPSNGWDELNVLAEDYINGVNGHD